MSPRACGLAVVSVLLALQGCTIVRVEGPGGEVSVRQGLGVVSVELTPRTAATVVDTKGFGFVQGPQGMTVGYQSARVAAIPAGECHLVVWIDTNAQLVELDRLLESRKDVCAVRPR